MRKLFAVVLIAATMGGCANAQTQTPIPSATITQLQNDALAARLSFQGALTVAVAYIERPRCGRPTSPPLCSDQAIVDVARKVIVAGDAATSAAEDAARTLNPDSTNLQALLVAARQATVSLTAVIPKL